MKKFFALMFAVMFLLSGCGSDSFSKNESSPEKIEQSKPGTPKELTPEEKSAKEAEKKAAEEKRIAEQQAAAEKKAQEEARRQAERQAEEERRASLLESGVQISYTIEKLAEHKYKVIGETNLPDGMKLAISLDNGNFIGDEQIQVRHGTFEATFGGKTNKLIPGECELSIISVVSSLQPKDIQSLLGKNGAHLFGMGVVDGEIFSTERQIVITEIIYLP